MSSQAAGFLNQPTKVGIQLGRTPGNVYLRNVRTFQCANALSCRLQTHDLQAIWASVHVAMAANLVALLTHIDLKDLNPRCRQRTESILLQEVIERRYIPVAVDDAKLLSGGREWRLP